MNDQIRIPGHVWRWKWMLSGTESRVTFVQSASNCHSTVIVITLQRPEMRCLKVLAGTSDDRRPAQLPDLNPRIG
jgi:hypothetical protein